VPRGAPVPEKVQETVPEKPARLSLLQVWGLGFYVKRFRGGLVFKAHRLLYHSTIGVRVTKKKKKFPAERRFRRSFRRRFRRRFRRSLRGCRSCRCTPYRCRANAAHILSSEYGTYTVERIRIRHIYCRIRHTYWRANTAHILGFARSRSAGSGEGSGDGSGDAFEAVAPAGLPPI